MNSIPWFVWVLAAIVLVLVLFVLLGHPIKIG